MSSTQIAEEKIRYFTISCYFKVLDAEMYGGIGSIGYACGNLGFENKMKGEPRDVVDGLRESMSTLLKVGPENVISISHDEYEANTEDD